MIENVHALWGLALRMKAREEGPDAVKAVRLSLRPRHRQDTFDAMEEFAVEKQQTELLLSLNQAGVSAAGDGHILEQLLAFISAHWADILSLILKLLPKALTAKLTKAEAKVTAKK